MNAFVVIVLVFYAMAPCTALENTEQTAVDRQGSHIFSDGFETGDMCFWQPGGCDVTVDLPGSIPPMSFVYVPPGTFWMGSPDGERSRWFNEDLHEVTLSNGYFLGQFEVTQGQW